MLALTALALSPGVRPAVLQRTREYIRNGYPVLEKWMNEHRDTFSITAPKAAAIAFIRYNLDVNSTEFADGLRGQKSVLIVPGDHFGLDHFIRVSFGLPHDYLTDGLNRIHDFIVELGG